MLLRLSLSRYIGTVLDHGLAVSCMLSCALSGFPHTAVPSRCACRPATPEWTLLPRRALSEQRMCWGTSSRPRFHLRRRSVLPSAASRGGPAAAFWYGERQEVASAEETEETARQARSSCKDDSLPDTSCLLVAALNTSLETTPEMMSAFIARL
ncbi:hypothetical protein FA09DRAFT_231145 [Tilletiopsis washingtonensis]|uniref:Uncharacterized protein n=1 Tax=Tilletiopsis washingtonensis TaxID=58919 RepID=A0A316ZGL9_9BASI|nr:hypothetical protein FA09DRAFT_231145 [Tilletiopsis washingtonensis]PWN99433.1 hypothetical protein FA09DRAFT_231145 [Tilletiopsis washingtonensis]